MKDYIGSYRQCVNYSKSVRLNAIKYSNADSKVNGFIDIGQHGHYKSTNPIKANNFSSSDSSGSDISFTDNIIEQEKCDDLVSASIEQLKIKSKIKESLIEMRYSENNPQLKKPIFNNSLITKHNNEKESGWMKFFKMFFLSFNAANRLPSRFQIKLVSDPLLLFEDSDKEVAMKTLTKESNNILNTTKSSGNGKSPVAAFVKKHDLQSSTRLKQSRGTKSSKSNLTLFELKIRLLTAKKEKVEKPAMAKAEKIKPFSGVNNYFTNWSHINTKLHKEKRELEKNQFRRQAVKVTKKGNQQMRKFRKADTMTSLSGMSPRSKSKLVEKYQIESMKSTDINTLTTPEHQNINLNLNLKSSNLVKRDTDIIKDKKRILILNEEAFNTHSNKTDTDSLDRKTSLPNQEMGTTKKMSSPNFNDKFRLSNYFENVKPQENSQRKEKLIDKCKSF